MKPSSRLVALAPEMDPSNGLIRVGGRLRRVADLANSIVHPVVLDSRHLVTRQIIYHYDNQLHHPGSEMLSRRKWRHSQILADRFWSRFIRDDLPRLQTRQKWQASPPDLREHTYIMIVDPQFPRGLWPIQQIQQIKLG